MTSKVVPIGAAHKRACPKCGELLPKLKPCVMCVTGELKDVRAVELVLEFECPSCGAGMVETFEFGNNGAVEVVQLPRRK